MRAPGRPIHGVHTVRGAPYFRSVGAEEEDPAARFVFSLSLPIILSAICPTGPHPPPRLARRPNQGHIGGGPRYMPMKFYRQWVQHFHPRSSTVKSSRYYFLTNQKKSSPIFPGTKVRKRIIRRDSNPC